MKKVLIGIADWSGSNKYLSECLQGIKDQTYTDYEIAVDDREKVFVTDPLLKEWKKTLDLDKENAELREPYTIDINDSEKVLSPSPAFTKWNEIIDKAIEGGYEYVAFPGADDIVLNDWLQECVSYLDAHPEAAFASTMGYLIDSQGNRLSQSPELPLKPKEVYDFKEIFYNMFKFGNFVLFPSCVWRVSALKDLRFTIDENLCGAADTLFYYQVLSKGFKMGIINKKLIKIRVHDQQYTEQQRGNGPIWHIEAMDRASRLVEGVRTWDLHVALSKLVSENEDRKTEKALRAKEKNAKEIGLVIVHEPPVNGTGILAEQLVKQFNGWLKDRITYYVMPDTTDEGNVIQNRYYNGMLIFTCKPELLKSLVKKLNPAEISLMHRNVWLTESDFLFEDPYKSNLVVYLHDSTWFCHRWHLVDYKQQICDGPSLEKCSKCVNLPQEQIANDLSMAQELLEKAPVIYANSDWTKSFYEKVFELKNIQVKTWKLPLLGKAFTGKRIGYFGGFSVVKGASVLMEAARKMPEYQFILFSDLPKDMLKGRKVYGFENVLVMGGYKREELPLLVNLVDVCVVPSLMESYGLVKRELESLGIPVVASKTGGMDGVVLPNNVEALVAAINAELTRLEYLRLL